jgi:hypothetical protein
MGLMRKKLRNCVGEKSSSEAGRQVYQALQPSAQVLAHFFSGSLPKISSAL